MRHSRIKKGIVPQVIRDFATQNTWPEALYPPPMPQVSEHASRLRERQIPLFRDSARGVRLWARFAAVATLVALAPAADAAVTVEAGPASTSTVDLPVTLSGSVTGQSILDFVT